MMFMNEPRCTKRVSRENLLRRMGFSPLDVVAIVDTADAGGMTLRDAADKLLTDITRRPYVPTGTSQWKSLVKHHSLQEAAEGFVWFAEALKKQGLPKADIERTIKSRVESGIYSGRIR